jgi:hypothetical protein
LLLLDGFHLTCDALTPRLPGAAANRTGAQNSDTYDDPDSPYIDMHDDPDSPWIDMLSSAERTLNHPCIPLKPRYLHSVVTSPVRIQMGLAIVSS